MRTWIFLTVLILGLSSCTDSSLADPKSFRQGEFIIPASENYAQTDIVRVDSFQIETYEGKVDTLVINWINNFKYDIRMLHPKSESDKDVIHVQIKKLREDSYDFVATIGYTNFTQNGTLQKK